MKKQIVSILMCLCMLLSLLPVSVLAKTDDILSLDISQGNISIENGTNTGTLKLKQGSNIKDNIDPSYVFVISGTTISYSITVSANLSKKRNTDTFENPFVWCEHRSQMRF